ncbi:LPS export ABC transporter ATP-binding protein [Blochmannia endosymbiont of Polyrhachis (Hedomyrma) turneri]|uniref:LPS export ABC transporter ATP-binding protein n=1 Tax=Blochmannia endosymbiont of Polyrhachis (Hedomyrma) turneri TaxID=1505596 RepID=UPI00061A6774|nr:LPS export ABC transporter ATP-binding protein [Blochmannia endosymbiont of Polyrhachis (Hedomyrma) turneri]AKC59636.1 Lipopolysaccharide export system ATP-binding protein LptB [Blochmannia endosymbiont of Polyrhachis (Hedomyrma) turneri]
MSILAAYNLKKTKKKQKIIHNVTLEINSGEIVGLLGPNGAGKSTIFYILLGIIQHDSGYILLNTINISTLPLYLRARHGMSYLPQENSIFRQLTVFNNLMAVLEIQKKMNKTQKYQHIKKIMNEFQISHLSNIKGDMLSGGERRRVEIARAITVNPKFILLDEPFSGIDPIAINNIKKIIKQLKKNGIGILITDHNVQETLNICNKAYILDKGTIIATGKPKAILNNKYLQQIYLGNQNNT